MEKPVFDVPKARCGNCDHEWTPRKADPQVCPECKNPNWDRGVEREHSPPFSMPVATCNKCDNSWHVETESPEKCPACKNPNWYK